MPVTSQSTNIAPLRPVTTLPVGRPGSKLRTARAPVAFASMNGRDAGEAISSSAVYSPTIGRLRPARANAASTNELTTRPAFMSPTPGP